MDLHGTASTTIPGIVDPSIVFFFHAQGPTTGVGVDVNSAMDGFPSERFTTPALAYTFGDPITIQMGLLAAMLAHAAGNGSPLDAEILYHNTASFTGLTVLDEKGSPVTSYTVSSESGTSYPLTVPEPTRAWLFVVGGLTLLGQRRGGALSSACTTPEAWCCTAEGTGASG